MRIYKDKLRESHGFYRSSGGTDISTSFWFLQNKRNVLHVVDSVSISQSSAFQGIPTLESPNFLAFAVEDEVVSDCPGDGLKV